MSTGRYQIVELLGRGSVGLVYTALDRATGRHVALKTLRDEYVDHAVVRDRFMREARIAATLEHPGIVPVHDAGEFDDGTPFYTMRIMPRRTLREVLDQHARDTHRPVARFCGIFAAVCRAMAYAHERGVIHRDLKPENVLLGDFGETYVADWGIAAVRGEASDEPVANTIVEVTRGGTRIGEAMGTPGYMAPEQIRGEWMTLDGRADLFALGAVLYEMLTGYQPFAREDADAEMQATLGDDPAPLRLTSPSCPLVLEDLCVRMLAKSPDHRPASAAIVANEIEAFLEGSRERERRVAEAVGLAKRAEQAVLRYHEAEREQSIAEREARNAAREVPPHASLESKRSVWAIEDRAKSSSQRQAHALAEAVDLYTQALGHDPSCESARQGLADLYYAQLESAERRRDEPACILHTARVLEFDPARYAPILRAPGQVTLENEGGTADVRVHPLIDTDRRLVPGTALVDARTPTRCDLAAGRYLVTFERDGFAPVARALRIARGEHRDLHVRLRAASDLAPGFVHVPAGEVTLGNDPDAFEPRPVETRYVDDFAIAIYPVTVGEYLEFLNDLERRDPARARHRRPRDEGTGGGGDGDYVRRDATGRWVEDFEKLVEGEGRQYCSRLDALRLPVFGVTWYDAIAYAAWKSARDGRHYRLPSDCEWETAAQGGDGRLFPWGDVFESTYCKGRDSRPSMGQPEPVGAFAFDESPHGVHDTAGSIRQWTSDPWGKVSARVLVDEPAIGDASAREEAGLRITRGGSWVHSILSARIASRFFNHAIARFSVVGFRLAHDLP